jgi:xanthine dehydrogenase accessory factor
MRDLFPDIDRWQQESQDIAMATLVAVRGSAPRPAGARLCVTRGGKLAGSISGGCVDGDVLERAMQVLNNVQPVLASYGIADELSLEVGLSCGGSIDVLIEPFAADEVWHAVRDAIESCRPAALAIGLEPGGIMGRKLAIFDGAPCVGSIDPELDAALGEVAKGLFCEGGTRELVLPWRATDAEDGARHPASVELDTEVRVGEARVFIEVIASPPRLYIVGATHTAIPLCRMARQLGFRVTVIDPRSTFATEERFPDADELILAWPDEALSGASLDSYSYVLTLIHDPKFDLPALEHALRSQARYIGALGSRSTHEARKERLRERGFSDHELARIRAPIGLDLGARAPAEIALAILAEVVAVRHDREGGALRERRAPIHSDG